ncbi:hypothetical protein ACIGO9_28810 [Nocardia asteroides]|uniref:phage tail termination protein n=1 Tax=Nocardia asteroides TaxID=1824 RepID=UPI0037C7B123
MSGFPDAELVVLDLLDDLGWCCTAMPDPEQWDALMPIIAVNRIGGGLDRDGITDRAMVAVVVVGANRPAAWQAAAAVRQRICSAGGTAVNGVLIDTASEETGNSQDPNLASDNRFVEATFWLSFRQRWQ